jgi:hypothetical protein
VDSASSVLVPAGLIAFLAAFPYILSWASGWNKLARHYRTDQEFSGQQWRYQFGQMGQASYGNSLTVGSSSEGLYLKASPLLRYAHPSLLIPWNDVSLTVKNRWILSYWEFHALKVPQTSLRLRVALGQKLVKAST